MKEEIKQLRVNIDLLAQLTKDLKPHWGKGIKFQIELGIPGFNSKEIEESAKSLLLAKTWLGKCLGELEFQTGDVVFSKSNNCKVTVIKNLGDKILCEWFVELLRYKKELDKKDLVNTPYVNDGNRKLVEDIEEAADTAYAKFVFFRSVDGGIKLKREDGEYRDIDDDITHIEKVDWLREEIQKLIEEVETLTSRFKRHTQRPTRELSIARTNTYNYLCEARFWLGFELGRCKNE